MNIFTNIPISNEKFIDNWHLSFERAFAVYEFLNLAKSGVSFEGLPWLVMIAGVASSAIVGYLCIAWFIKLISKVSLTVFSIYCWIAGTILLIVLPKVVL